MDPVTAIGLATNVLQVVDVSWKVVSKSREIYKNGALPEHRDMLTVTADLQNVNSKLLGCLKEAEKEQCLNDEQNAFRQLCESSSQIGDDLVRRLTAVNGSSGWKSVRHALKSTWSKKDLDETAARLQAYRTQLNTRFLLSLHGRIDRLDQNTKDIALNLSEDRALSNTNQEIQTQFLTKLISSQHEKTRELFTSLALPGQQPPPYAARAGAGAVASSPQPANIPEKEEMDVFQAVIERSVPKLRRILRRDPSAIFAFNDSGQTALHIAASVGDAELVSYLIRNGARINPDDDHSKIPLHYGVQSGSVAVVRALLAKGADVQAKDGDGRTAKELCSPSSLLGWILSHGTNLEATNSEGFTALFHFATMGDSSAVRTLLDLGADIEMCCRLDQTPLLEAAIENNVEVLKILLERGANVHSRNYRQDTALTAAAWHGHTKIGELLLDHGADIDATNMYLYAALHECCRHGRVEMGLMLIRRGAKCEEFNVDGKTPLHHAAGRLGHHALVSALLDRGVDVNLPERHDRWTALAEACCNGHPDIVRILLERGAAPNARVGRNRSRETALIGAAERGRAAIVECMLGDDGGGDGSGNSSSGGYGVNIEAKDDEGRTALIRAVMGAHVDTVRVLLERGADVKVLDGRGRVPLAYAMQNGLDEIFGLLVAAGAGI